ncbi:MAG: hypothetical protein IJQ31_03745 [Thermoguttaceae bacterium]|nr:hypothetical protein [Thermoguttaceae bacterium]
MSSDQKNSRISLTVRQREVLEFIRKCFRKRGYGPTVRELAKGIGIHSPNGVMGHLDALQRKGYIKRQANLSRSIILMESADPRKDGFPVAALLENGRLVENPDPHERLNVHEQMHLDGPDFSWIRIQTDSRMNGFSLKKGDLLLVRHSSSASEGDSVVIRDFGKNFQLAKCQMDGVTGKTFLTTGTRRLENSNAKVFGILVFMIRFKF